MPTVVGGTQSRIAVQARAVLTVTADGQSSGIIRRVPQGSFGNLSGQNRIQTIGNNGSKIIGPFPTDRAYSIEALGNGLNYTISMPQYDYAALQGNIEPFTGSFRLKSEDMGKLFRCDDAAAVSIGVPNDLLLGFNCGFITYTAAIITLVPETGVTALQSRNRLTAQWQRGSMLVTKQSGVNTLDYFVSGDFAA